nr:unnamed protein product [Callosobruchus chinensis]
MQKEIEGMRNELELCKKLINEQSEVNSLQKSKILQLETDNVNKPLFSHVVASTSKSKFNINIPDNDSGVLLINSETQNAKEVMASVQSKIKPSELNISVNKTRPIKNGMLINCSKKNISKVKEIISSKLGNEYTVREGTKRNPRIRISGVDSKTASKDTFIDEMFNQTEQLKSVSTDGVKWVFSKKWHNTVDVILEAPPQIRRLLLDLGCVYAGRDRAGRGGGVGFYVKNSLQCNILDFRIENAGNLEYLWLNVKFNGKKICICVIYRPPRSKLQDCLQYLDSVLPKCLVEFDNIILLGDFN